MAVASPPNSALPAELGLQRIEPGRDDRPHRSAPVVPPGDPSRVAMLPATAAPDNEIRTPAQPSDPKSPARPEAQGGQGSKGCDVLQQYLRLGECAATLPIAVP